MKINITRKLKDNTLRWAIGYIKNFLLEKDASYGSKNLELMGEVGLYIRLRDKIGRLDSYYLDDKEMSLESVEDTWRDIAGYAIQWLRFFSDYEDLDEGLHPKP